jgi:hypothetical protein
MGQSLYRTKFIQTFFIGTGTVHTMSEIGRIWISFDPNSFFEFLDPAVDPDFYIAFNLSFYFRLFS